MMASYAFDNIIQYKAGRKVFKKYEQDEQVSRFKESRRMYNARI